MRKNKENVLEQKHIFCSRFNLFIVCSSHFFFYFKYRLAEINTMVMYRQQSAHLHKSMDFIYYDDENGNGKFFSKI